jgi:DNA-binding beta-propeller fold protein YncE
MSLDVKAQRLFIAALGNNAVEVIDLKAGKRVRTIGQLREPQGVLFIPGTNRLFVANGSDGSVRIFDGDSYALLKTLDYSDDADNLRYDPARNRIYVGYS